MKLFCKKKLTFFNKGELLCKKKKLKFLLIFYVKIIYYYFYKDLQRITENFLLEEILYKNYRFFVYFVINFTKYFKKKT